MKKNRWAYSFIAITLLLIVTTSCKKNDALDTTMTDVDGNIYQTTTIGTQTWMAENLRTTKYQNGDQIPNITDGAEWIKTRTGAFAWYNNDEAGNKENYGALYNHYVISDSRNLAPKGWHIPTDEEWITLEMYLGMNNARDVETGWRGTDQGTQLKSTTGWNNSGNGSNTSGFCAQPSGERTYGNGSFRYAGIAGTWWTATETDAGHAKIRYLAYSHEKVYRYGLDKRHGFSIRCVKD